MVKKIVIILICLSIVIGGIYICINRSNSEKLANIIYSIENKDFYLYEDSDEENQEYRGIKLLEYDNSNNNYAEIYYLIYDYVTEPSVQYTLKLNDKFNNNIIIDKSDEMQVIPGIVSSIKIQKLDLDNIINFAIFEKDTETNNVINSAQTQIIIEKDLKEKEKISQNENLTNGILGDISFKYIDSEYTYFGKTEHSYSKNLLGELCSIPIKIQYGSKLIPEDHIEFSYNSNVNNLTLEEAFESLALITETLGQYGLSDIYGMDIVNENGEITDTIIINFNEMIKLCNGFSIEKDGKNYTKDSFNRFAELQMVREENVKIGNEINAIKYSFESEENYTNYIFVCNDNIYNLKVPINTRISTEIEEFLDSLEQNI